MTKSISKPIMQITRFGNKFVKNPTDQNESMYQKERNHCVHLLRKEKKIFSENIEFNEKEVAKTFNDLFSNVVKYFEILKY